MLGGLVALAALGACDRPQPLVVCHNANCAEPVDPASDDTLDALRASLALELDGRPVIDGVELDSFWRGADGMCLFAHDLDGANEPPATAPALELATYFARSGPISYSDKPFTILLELKSHVSADKADRHTPEQRASHAACAWEIYAVIASAAVAHNRDVHVLFSAFAPELLTAVIAATPASTPVAFGYSAIQGVPAPLDNQTRPLGDYAGIPLEVIEFHANWLLDAQYEATLGYRAKLAMFVFALTGESLASIEQYDPYFVSTNEARLLRRWLNR